MRVLLADPDEYYHTQIARELADLADLQVVSNARAAREQLSEDPPDILVMELLLPDQPGYTLLEELRQHPEHRNLPIIIFSEVDAIEDIQAALQFGVVTFFVKGQNSIGELKRLLLSYARV